MNKNNDSDSRKGSPDLEEYLAREIIQYYGEDIINHINSSLSPIPKNNNRKNGFLSALGIFCAIIFLTGAMIFSSVLLTSNISKSNPDSDFSEAYSDNSINTSHKAESDTDTNVSVVSEIENCSESTSTFSSSYYADFKTQTTSESETTSMDTDIVSSSLNTNTDEEVTDFDVEETDTESASSEFNTSEEGNLTASESDSDSSYITNEDISTDIIVSSETPPKTNTDDTANRPNYFSLPEFPEEGGISTDDTDENNNSSTNPYDNVTTGRKVRAGLGIVLMTLSLAAALALNKFKYNEM